MLPQKNRLNRQKFDYVYRTGENVQADIGYVKFTVTDDKHIACVASKNDFPNNVDRTRVRRRGYAVVSKFLQEIPDGVSLIWFLPKSAKKADFSRLETTFQYVIEQIKESIAN